MCGARIDESEEMGPVLRRNTNSANSVDATEIYAKHGHTDIDRFGTVWYSKGCRKYSGSGCMRAGGVQMVNWVSSFKEIQIWSINVFGTGEISLNPSH